MGLTKPDWWPLSLTARTDPGAATAFFPRPPMLAIGRQPAPIAGDYIDGGEIGDQRHSDPARAGEAGKLDVEGIAAGDAQDAAPFTGMGSDDWAGFITGQAHQIARLGDNKLRAIGSCIYPHRQNPGFPGCDKPLGRQ